MEKNIKIYFEDSGDIRRVNLHAKTLQELFHRLRQVIEDFWTASDKGFELLYRDDENDFIKLSTADEMKVCLTCPNNKELLRIYVRDGVAKCNDADEKSAAAGGEKTCNAVWSSVICDQCQDSPLKGIRYKCLVCFDYDECASCFKKHRHAHPMLALTDPNDRSWNPIARRSFRMFQNRGPERNTEGQARFQPRFGGGWKGPRCSGFSQNNFPYHHMDNKNNNTNNNNAKKDPTIEMDIDMDDLARNPNRVRTHLMDVLNNTAKMFQNMAVGANTNSNAENSSKVPEFKDLFKSNAQPTFVNPNADQQASTSANKAVETEQVKNDETEKVVEDIVETSAVVVETEKPNDETPQKATTSSKASSVDGSESSKRDDWTVVESDEKKTAEEQVSASIESLREMGFDVEKKWLYNLVRTCEGDLSKVLDELTPNKL